MARSRISLGIFLPTTLLGIAVITWAIGWFFLANEAEERIVAVIDQASERGWTLTCEEDAIGGFPFRIEFECASPQLVIENTKGRMTIRSRHLRGVALVYNLDQAIAEITGPTSLETFQLGGLRRTYQVDTDSARASVDFADGEAVAVSVVMSAIDARIPTLDFGNSGEASSVSVERAAFHVRQAEGDALDLAATLDGSYLTGELAQVFFESPNLFARTLDFLGRLTKKAALQNGSIAANAAAWQAAGGELQIQHFKIDAPALDVEISGVGKLDGSGKIDGKFKGVFGKLNRLIEDLKTRGVLNDDGARLAAGAIGLLARPVKGSSKAELPVKVSAGAVFLGPIKTMILPPLF